jgi:hypothetical protein
MYFRGEITALKVKISAELTTINSSVASHRSLSPGILRATSREGRVPVAATAAGINTCSSRFGLAERQRGSGISDY